MSIEYLLPVLLRYGNRAVQDGGEIEVQMRGHAFPGTNSMSVVDFLQEFIWACDDYQTHESAAMSLFNQ